MVTHGSVGKRTCKHEDMRTQTLHIHTPYTPIDTDTHTYTCRRAHKTITDVHTSVHLLPMLLLIFSSSTFLSL